MNLYDPAQFVVLVAIVGVVIVLAASVSGLIDRLGVPQVAIFLLLGTALGPYGLGYLEFGLDSAPLGTIATISLILVLFTDAVSIDTAGLKTHLTLALLVLGPGTLLTAFAIGVSAWALLDATPPQAAVVGAALASTDPVMMRGLLRRSDVPTSARYALGLESGLNDAVLLPIVLIAMGLMQSATGMATPPIGRVLVNVFVLGPLAGVAVGFVAVSLLERTRRRFGMRRDYESLYVLGVAFTAYAAGEALHGSGFMAAFAAGVTVTFLDVELCDCFHDYGEATSEMFLLFAFVAFGASLIWMGVAVAGPRTLAFALVALLGRSIVLMPALAFVPIDPHSRRLVVWFGPRALSSLLLVLLPVFAGVPGAARLFPICALVVLLSVVCHGALLAALSSRRRAAVPLPAPGTSPAARPAPATASLVADRVLVTPDELARLRASGAPLVVVDARTRAAYDASDARASGSVRLDADRAVAHAHEIGLARDAWLAILCA
jgi:NhaP-type Na+/H+ or K+/H+ antiporter